METFRQTLFVGLGAQTSCQRLAHQKTKIWLLFNVFFLCRDRKTAEENDMFFPSFSNFSAVPAPARVLSHFMENR